MPRPPRPTTLRRLAATIVAALALAACGTQTAPPAAGGSSGATSAPGVRAPLDFRAQTVDGGGFSASDLAGEAAVLWFWAWCPICSAEGPGVARVARQYADEVTFVGVAGRGQVPEMRRFVADTGTGSFTHAVDKNGDVWSSFGVTSQPAFAFIRPDGGMEVIVGTLPEDDLAAEVSALAGGGGRPGPR